MKVVEFVTPVEHDPPTKKKWFDRTNSTKIKKIVKKGVNVLRAGYEVYLAFKKKDPFYIGLSTVSACSAIEDIRK